MKPHTNPANLVSDRWQIFTAHTIDHTPQNNDIFLFLSIFHSGRSFWIRRYVDIIKHKNLYGSIWNGMFDGKKIHLYWMPDWMRKSICTCLRCRTTRKARRHKKNFIQIINKLFSVQILGRYWDNFVFRFAFYCNL